jgi:hypothetical protein
MASFAGLQGKPGPIQAAPPANARRKEVQKRLVEGGAVVADTAVGVKKLKVTFSGSSVRGTAHKVPIEPAALEPDAKISVPKLVDGEAKAGRKQKGKSRAPEEAAITQAQVGTRRPASASAYRLINLPLQKSTTSHTFTPTSIQSKLLATFHALIYHTRSFPSPTIPKHLANYIHI